MNQNTPTRNDEIQEAVCLSCKGTLFSADGYIRGTEFSTKGHYGSIFDPMESGLDLIIWICNDCLAANKSLAVLTRTSTSTDISYRPYV